jgi:Zn-dependent peptidase ImmA (M78 family)
MFVRGFKTWCENIAAQHRGKLELKPHDPLQASVLATQLGVEVKTPKDLPGLDEAAMRVLLHDDPGSWSAVTLSVQGKDLVILNPSHRGGRPNSDLMHELSHLLLGHKPGQSFISADGATVLSAFNKSQEDEANWLAGALLLPRVALMHIRRQRLPDGQVIQQYNVSGDMLRWRVNVTGIDRQMKPRFNTKSPPRPQ